MQRPHEGPSADDVQALRASWDAWCTSLAETGRRVLDGELAEAADSRELAEALRATMRMAAMAVQQRLDFNDPDFPRFFRALDDRAPYAGPDAHITYLSAAVRGDATYRISGHHHDRQMNLGRLWSADLETDDEGRFEIIASADELPGNWVALDPAVVDPTAVPDLYPMAAGGLTGRFYVWDPDDVRPIEIAIERIDDGRPEMPEPLTVDRLAGQIDAVTRLTGPMVEWWLRRAERIREEHEPNVVGPPGVRPPGVPTFQPPPGSPLNYGVCCWELADDEVLVIDTALPDAEYWSFQAYDPWWESPDVQFRQTSIGHTSAFVDADGRFRAVVAHRDPGVPNWLDTAGARRGFVFYRWLRPAGAMPTPIGTVCPFEHVRDRLPADHPAVAPDERRAALAERAAWFAARWQA